MTADKAALAAERRQTGAGTLPERPHGGGDGMPLDRDDAFYRSAEARGIADNIVSFQTPAGGWGKNQNRSGPPRVSGEGWAIVEKLPPYAAGDIQAADAGWAYVGTIDNGATTTEMRFLARVETQHPGRDGDVYRAAFAKGVRYLLAAQYPNGGWPQVYPLQGGYHDAITYNDDAVVEVARLLAEVGAAGAPYGFVAPEIAAKARAAANKALTVLLRSQIVVNGRRTIWAQQHDALTLAPVGARAFEPVALSSAESAGILRFLMEQPAPSPAVIAAVESGIAWLAAHGLRDVEWSRADARLNPKPGAGPIWARLYDVETFKPVFGDRDHKIYDDVSEISQERRRGYSWFNAAPSAALARYPAWKQQTAR
ncbi:pectate lyase [Sphingosinicella sp. BN140058]|nr:pectate lyase [Sphingosinicella sp. BN140058]